MLKKTTTIIPLALLTLLMTMTMVLTTTTTLNAAYAQSQQSKACPESYTIQKGKCVGPAVQTETQVCPDEGPNGDRVDLIILPSGEYCTIGTVSSILVCPPGTLQIDVNRDKCYYPETLEIVDMVPGCSDPTNQVLNPDGNVSCFVIIPFVTETTTTCGVEGAILNTEANTCTIKPGNKA
jgi:hypothetical protein